MQNRFFPLLFFSIYHFGEIQIFVISIGFLLIFYWKIKYQSPKIWKFASANRDWRICERLNRKSVVSPQGNSYRSWFECVPHRSKALGKGAIRVSATSWSWWCTKLRYWPHCQYPNIWSISQHWHQMWGLHCIWIECTIARFNLVYKATRAGFFIYL